MAAIPSRDGLREARTHRPRRLAHLPGLYDLRRAGPRPASVDAGRGGEPADHPARPRPRHQLLRHRQRLLRRHQRRDRRPRPARLRPARRGRPRHQGLLSDAAGPRTSAVCRARPSSRRSTPACGASAPTTSTCIRFTAGTTTRRSRRRSRRCTTWSSPARSATSAPRRCSPGSSARSLYVARGRGLDAVRDDAEPLQPALPRGGARDAAAVRGGGHRRHSVEPAGARPPHPRRRASHRRASETDEYGKTLYEAHEASDRQVIEAVAAVAADRGVPRAQVALAWLLHKPVVTAPIVGASRVGPPRGCGRRAGRPDTRRLRTIRRTRVERPYMPHPIAGFE